MWSVIPVIMATAGTRENLCSLRWFPDILFLSHILKWKKSFFVVSHENIFDIHYFVSMQGHNNLGNDEYQVFFKDWHSASSAHLPRSDFLMLRKAQSIYRVQRSWAF